MPLAHILVMVGLLTSVVAIVGLRFLGRRMLRAVAKTGVAVGLIEHDMEFVMSDCDRITVLDLGRVIASGTQSRFETTRKSSRRICEHRCRHQRCDTCAGTTMSRPGQR